NKHMWQADSRGPSMLTEHFGIVEVKHSSLLKEVNELLKEGWRLLGTSHGVDENSYPIVIYALGREE
ncbi:hypothetical protein, partial [Halomonas sp. B23F22_10]|uniref:hypothetical protein n=1 Tax=Halomonas sp. B23F22_10 TaxID=3459515 RepID=UPI00373E0378